MMIGPTFVSVREAARLLDMSERLVLRFLAYGRIKGAQKEGGKWLVPVPVEFVSGDDASGGREVDAAAFGDEAVADYSVGDTGTRLSLELLPEELVRLSEAARRAGVSVEDFIVAAALERAIEDGL